MWEVGLRKALKSVSLYYEAGLEADDEAYYHCPMTNWMSDSITTPYMMNNLLVQSHAWGLSHSLWQRVKHYPTSVSNFASNASLFIYLINETCWLQSMRHAYLQFQPCIYWCSVAPYCCSTLTDITLQCLFTYARGAKNPLEVGRLAENSSDSRCGLSVGCTHKSP